MVWYQRRYGYGKLYSLIDLGKNINVRDEILRKEDFMMRLKDKNSCNGMEIEQNMQ